MRGEPPAADAGWYPRARRGLHLHLGRDPWRDAAGRQYSRKAGDTLEQAEAFKRRIDDQLALGTYTPTSTTTFAVYANSWIEAWPLKDQTRERYRGILRRELLPVFGPIPLAKIHPHQVRTWVAEQVAGPLSASSVRQHIAVLRSCLKAAQIDGHIDTLPLLGVKMRRVGRGPRRAGRKPCRRARKSAEQGMRSVTEPSAGAAGPIPVRGATGGSRRGRPGAGSLRKEAVGDIRTAPAMSQSYPIPHLPRVRATTARGGETWKRSTMRSPPSEQTSPIPEGTVRTARQHAVTP